MPLFTLYTNTTDFILVIDLLDIRLFQFLFVAYFGSTIKNMAVLSPIFKTLCHLIFSL